MRSPGRRALVIPWDWVEPNRLRVWGKRRYCSGFLVHCSLGRLEWLAAAGEHADGDGERSRSVRVLQVVGGVVRHSTGYPPHRARLNTTISQLLILCQIMRAPIHQFFLDVKVMRLTATDPTGGTDRMDVIGLGELGTVADDNMPNEGRGRLWSVWSIFRRAFAPAYQLRGFCKPRAPRCRHTH